MVRVRFMVMVGDRVRVALDCHGSGESYSIFIRYSGSIRVASSEPRLPLCCELGLGLGLGLKLELESVLGLGFGLEEVFVFDSKSENRDRAVEAVESVSEARAV